jgi:trk system potassium uptake protein TrkA
VRFPAGTLVVSDQEGSRIARPDTRLVPGQRYIVATEPDVSREVMQLLRG